MREGYVFCVSKLNDYVAELLCQDPMLKNISVEGEISGFKRYGSGHCYFTLKDESAVIRAVMFKQNAFNLSFEPRDGMRIIANGYVSIYARDGQYQLYVTSMRQVGEGELFMRFVEIKAKLELEGIFAREHKKPIPMLPKCIGVVTSKTGAVFHDIVNVVRRRFPNMNVRLCHSAVQGADAPKELISALNTLDLSGKVDCIIIGRGGGSIEDLWAFNDEMLANAIYNCKTPVISAVGHETDFTICDFVADMRAPTPSAAAELAVPIYDDMLLDVDSCDMHMRDALLWSISLNEQILDGFSSDRVICGMQNLLSTYQNTLNYELDIMNTGFTTFVRNRESALELLTGKLIDLSPRTVLKRGFAYVHDERGESITTAKGLDKVLEDTNAIVEFVDGAVKVCRE